MAHGTATTGARVSLGGVAVVCCVHDREKRRIVTEQQVVELGFEVGVMFDPRQHRIHRCGCCENLFVDPSDEPKFCGTCRNPPSFALGGPLAAAVGEVDG